MKWIIAAVVALAALAAPALAQFNGCGPGFCNGIGSSGGNIPASVASLSFTGGTASGTCASITACITDARANAETCTDATGNITYAANNTACITSAGIQNYGASSNIITDSQLLTTGWGLNNATVSCGATAPDGTATACTLTDNATNAIHQIISASNSALVNGTYYTWSGYFHAGTLAGATGQAGQVVQIVCTSAIAACNSSYQFVTAVLGPNGYIANGASSVINPGIKCWSTGSQAGWCRVWFSFVAVSSQTTRAMAIYMQNSPQNAAALNYAGSGSTILIWGTMVNTGPLVPYIPTVATAVSVAADQITATGGLATALQASSMYAVFGVAQPPSPFGATTPGVIFGTNTTGTGLAAIAGNQAQTGIGAGGNLTISGQQFENFATNFIGIGCSSAGRSIVLNGGTFASDTNVCGTLTAENIGSLSDGTKSINGNITSLTVWATRNDYAMQIATATSTIRPPVPAYTGEIATGTGVPNSLSTTNLQFNSRALIHFMDNSSCVTFKLPNYYVNVSSSGVESGSGAAATVTAALEYPSGTFTQIKFSGSTSGSIPNGSELNTDAVCPTGGVTAYTNGFLRVFWTSTTGLVAWGNNTNYPIDAANGEAMNQAASGLSDLTLGGAITQNPAGSIYRPTAIFATTTRPTICIVGDSRAVGYQDTDTDTHDDKGEIERTVGTRYAYVNVAVAGDQVAWFVLNHTNRLAETAYCTNVITEYGVNDIYLGGSSPALAETNLTTLWGYFSGKRVFQSTIMGETTSTDNWATAGNQTLIANSSNLVTLDDWIRTTPTPLIAYFENANALQTSQDSLIWLSNGVALTYTFGGVHETMYGYLTIKSFGGINLGLIQ